MVESGTNTEPANSRRAVRMSEARRTGTSAPGGASSSSIGMRPAGCSMTTRAVAPRGSGPANSWARLPGTTQAVARPIAPVAATERWQACGVK